MKLWPIVGIALALASIPVHSEERVNVALYGHSHHFGTNTLNGNNRQLGMEYAKDGVLYGTTIFVDSYYKDSIAANYGREWVFFKNAVTLDANFVAAYKGTKLVPNTPAKMRFVGFLTSGIGINYKNTFAKLVYVPIPKQYGHSLVYVSSGLTFSF